MSLIVPLIEEYITDFSSEEPAYLRSIRQQALKEKNFSLSMLSGVYQGRILSLLSKIQRPKWILEIGTFIGYSALCLAEGLKDEGKLITLELNEKWKKIAKKNFEVSIYKEKIQLIYGDALDSIRNLEERFDFVFIDADKKNYIHYIDLIIPKMQKGGLILSDNVLWRGEVAKSQTEDKKALYLQQYNKKLKQDPRIENFILPIRDGLSISRVL